MSEDNQQMQEMNGHSSRLLVDSKLYNCIWTERTGIGEIRKHLGELRFQHVDITGTARPFQITRNDTMNYILFLVFFDLMNTIRPTLSTHINSTLPKPVFAAMPCVAVIEASKFGGVTPNVTCSPLLRSYLIFQSPDLQIRRRHLFCISMITSPEPS